MVEPADVQPSMSSLLWRHQQQSMTPGVIRSVREKSVCPAVSLPLSFMRSSLMGKGLFRQPDTDREYKSSTGGTFSLPDYLREKANRKKKKMQCSQCTQSSQTTIASAIAVELDLVQVSRKGQIRKCSSGEYPRTVCWLGSTHWVLHYKRRQTITKSSDCFQLKVYGDKVI